MKHLRRHWRLVGLVFCVALFGASLILWQQDGAAVAQEPPASLDEAQHGAVLGLLNDVSLDRDALIALNPSSAQAETLLETTKTWYLNNTATLASLQLAINQARDGVRDLEAAMAMGPPQEGQQEALEQARQQLASAEAAYKSQLAQLRSSLETELSQSQRAVWGAIESGWGQDMPIRLLALSDAQRLALSAAWKQFGWAHAAASSPAERADALNTWESALAQILTPDQETMVTAYLGYYASASQAVASAYEAQMPGEA